MRAWRLLVFSVMLGTGGVQGALASGHADRQKCRSYGFQEGTDGFANCMMQLDQHRGSDASDRFDRIDKYRALSQQRQGDDRYPVCRAGNMNAELDTELNKWVGPDCQMAP